MAAFGTQIYTDLEGFFICLICLICVRLLLSGCVSAHRLLRALRWPFGLPFGREHFVVITDLEGLFYLLHLLNLRETLAARLCFGTQNTQNALK